VASLKDMIKDKHAPMLHKVADRDLVLWKCSGLPDDDNLEQTSKTLQFDGSDNHLVRLASARRQISQIFGDKDLSKEPIHVLVGVPPLGECDICICYSILKGLISSSPAKVSMHSSFICLMSEINGQTRSENRGERGARQNKGTYHDYTQKYV
jgi:Crinkler effector protein N-terminal domain